MPLPRSFYDRSPDEVAGDLLGKSIVRMTDHGRVGGLIVETEAYLDENDPASHSHRGPTRRNASMFGPAGTLYVYAIHNRCCLNAVTQGVGIGSAVLIRAIEPVWNIDQMRTLRGQTDTRMLCSGPGRLCQAMGIDRSFDGIDLCRDPSVEIDAFPTPRFVIVTTGRIGISRGSELPLRFFIDGNVHVSGPARDHTVPRRNTLLE